METRKRFKRWRSKVSTIFITVMAALSIVLPGESVCHAETVSLQWGTSTGATGYKVYYQADTSTAPFSGTGASEGSAPVDVANQTSASISGLDPAHAYYFAVTAYNTAGESSYSNIVSVPEQTSPTTSISYPANNASVGGTVAITASATDNVGVTSVGFYVNGVLQGTDTSAPYTYSWNTSSLASGTYTLTSRAYDAAGNVGESSAVTVTVANDSTAPTVALTSPAGGATLSGTATIAASASDNVGVSKVEFYANGTLLSASNIAPYSYNWNTASITNGSYTLLARAYDSAGNVGQSSAITVTVNNQVADTTAPTVSSFTMPSTSTSLTVAISALTATDAVGVTGYLVTESSTKPSATASGWSTSAPTSFTFSGAGMKTAYAWAKDAAGNVSGSLSRTVTITLPDTTAPTVSSFTMPSTSTSLTVAISALTATDAVGVTGYLVTESSTKPSATASGWSTSAPTSFTFSGAGMKTAYAWAKDAAGNVSGSLSRTVTITLPDTTAPTVSIISPLANSVVKGTKTIYAAASDNVKVTKVEFYVNGVLRLTSGSSPFRYSLNTKTVANGPCSLMAKAYDAAGNMKQSSAVSVTVRN